MHRMAFKFTQSLYTTCSLSCYQLARLCMHVAPEFAGLELVSVLLVVAADILLTWTHTQIVR
jgi:hypothetical protein